MVGRLDNALYMPRNVDPRAAVVLVDKEKEDTIALLPVIRPTAAFPGDQLANSPWVARRLL